MNNVSEDEKLADRDGMLVQVNCWYDQARDDELPIGNELEVRKTLQKIRNLNQELISDQDPKQTQLIEQFKSRADFLSEYFKQKWTNNPNPTKQSKDTKEKEIVTAEDKQETLNVFSGDFRDWPFYKSKITELVIQKPYSASKKYRLIYETLDKDSKDLVYHIDPNDPECVDEMLTILKTRFDELVNWSSTLLVLMKTVEAFSCIDRSTQTISQWNQMLKLAVMVKFRMQNNKAASTKASRILFTKLPSDCRTYAINSIDDLIERIQMEIAEFSTRKAIPQLQVVNNNYESDMEKEFAQLLTNKRCPICAKMGHDRKHPLLMCRNLVETYALVNENGADDIHPIAGSSLISNGRSKFVSLKYGMVIVQLIAGDGNVYTQEALVNTNLDRSSITTTLCHQLGIQFEKTPFKNQDRSKSLGQLQIDCGIGWFVRSCQFDVIHYSNSSALTHICIGAHMLRSFSITLSETGMQQTVRKLFKVPMNGDDELKENEISKVDDKKQIALYGMSVTLEVEPFRNSSSKNKTSEDGLIDELRQNKIIYEKQILNNKLISLAINIYEPESQALFWVDPYAITYTFKALERLLSTRTKITHVSVFKIFSADRKQSSSLLVWVQPWDVYVIIPFKAKESAYYVKLLKTKVVKLLQL